MSESTAIPLSTIIRKIASTVPTHADAIAHFSAGRCEGNDAQVQYVYGRELEKWQTKHPRELALDTLEELGDAFAYLAALADKDRRWLMVMAVVSLAFDMTEELGWESRDAAK